MVEVRELERVSQEEHRRVIADEVPVPFLCVKLDREAADANLSVVPTGGSSTTADSVSSLEQADSANSPPATANSSTRTFAVTDMA